MKKNFLALLTVAMVGTGAVSAQDCTTTAALAYDAAKAKKLRISLS